MRSLKKKKRFLLAILNSHFSFRYLSTISNYTALVITVTNRQESVGKTSMKAKTSSQQIMNHPSTGFVPSRVFRHISAVLGDKRCGFI